MSGSFATRLELARVGWVSGTPTELELARDESIYYSKATVDITSKKFW